MKSVIRFIAVICILYCAGCSTVIPKVTYDFGRVAFKTAAVPSELFPVQLDERKVAAVEHKYEISETEVTYGLWSEVYKWATSDDSGVYRYTIANLGRAGGGSRVDCGSGADALHPVTEVSWWDCVVWVNALTEWYNAIHGTTLSLAYYFDSSLLTPLRDSRDMVGNPVSSDHPYVRQDATGFRIPYANEWELAARYKGDFNNDGNITGIGEYYPGNYVSGATKASYEKTETAKYAWYSENSGGMSHTVMTKNANTLGLYDMSGSVYEWCFDWDSRYKGINRVYRGGSWASNWRQLGIGVLYYNGAKPYFTSDSLGFRIARSIE
jgi:formylglycine-generating enzyme required for sulfatase activity